ncbi:hypothetical protein [Microbacterium terrisoli]|uniref:hypothetical protein n=1 Tax=Microbacterium terrisoli TaxID=3242192 RepID=UPI0028049624|nr:hypothetical protein [Microbacterium protaetiae]
MSTSTPHGVAPARATAPTLPRSAGIGLLIYSLATFAAFLFSGSPGGDYSDRQVTAYLTVTHGPTAFALWYVAALGALALVLFAAGVRRLPTTGAPLAALATIGAAVSVTGAWLSGGLAVAMAEGSDPVRTGIPHPVAYVLTEVGNLMAVCGPALCVGVIALVLAARGGVSVWLRVCCVIGGVCGILAPYFYTYFIYMLFTVVFAVALIAARRAPTRPSRRISPVPRHESRRPASLQ